MKLCLMMDPNIDGNLIMLDPLEIFEHPVCFLKVFTV